MSGTVKMKVVVGSDGKVKKIVVTRPLGYGLDEEAIRSVRQWKFKPALKDGDPVSVEINVEISFRI